MPDSIRQVPRDRIRVLIVDSQAMVRSVLCYFLLAFDDLELVGEATNGQEALELCAQVRPDVVLIDLMIPGMDAVSATRTIIRRFPQTCVITLTSLWGKELVNEVLQAGATAFLLKNVSAEDLADAIRVAHVSQSTLTLENKGPLDVSQGDV